MTPPAHIAVWRCPTHGFLEATLEHRPGDWEGNQWVPSTPWRECPVSLRYDEVCRNRLDGPFSMSITSPHHLPLQRNAARAVISAYMADDGIGPAIARLADVFNLTEQGCS